MGRGLSPGHVLHCFLLALHTNLAADEAKLGVWCCARTGGGDTEARTDCTLVLAMSAVVEAEALLTV